MWSKKTDTWTAAGSIDLQVLRAKDTLDLVLDQSVLRNICLIMAVVLTLFGANNLSTGFQVLGVIDFVLAAGMLVSAIRLFYSQPTLTLVLGTLTAGALAVLMAIYSNAFGIYWSYVIAVAAFLVINKRTALIFNLVFIVIAVALVVEVTDVAVAVRLAITLLLVTAFSYIFSMRVENRTKALIRNLRELEKANSVKSEFIANMSHEMRTPLTAVLGYSEDIASQNELSPTDQEKLKSVVVGARHLASLIDDVLDLTKTEKNQLDVYPEATRLSALLDNLLQILKPEAKNKGIELSFTQAPHIPEYIFIDPRRLNQILMNLLANAIKFTNEGSVNLSVLYHAGTASLVFEVKDTGIGVPEEFRADLFEKFSQADTGMNRSHGGAGLGLYISRNIALLLSGDIEYVPQDQGSTFRLTVKAEEATEAQLSEAQKKTVSDSGNPAGQTQFEGHVLIAEDSPANQMLIGLIVAKFGLTHDCVDNGQEAVEAMRSASYDLILMDLQMPVMSGIEATKEIRSFNRDVPIVALSADVIRHDANSEEMREFSGMLPKPIDLAKMEEMFARFLPG